MLYEYLKGNYEPGEPIFSGDISISGLSEENLRYHLKRLTDDGIPVSYTHLTLPTKRLV